MARVIAQRTPGSVSNPIPVLGGVSILAVQETRKILTADPRDAVLRLKQISINFPKGTSKAQAEPLVARFAEAARFSAISPANEGSVALEHDALRVVLLGMAGSASELSGLPHFPLPPARLGVRPATSVRWL